MKKQLLALLLTAALLCLTLLPAAAAMCGDVNGDSQITAADARLALRAAVKLENLTAQQKIAADADGSGSVTAADARLILRASVKLESLTCASEGKAGEEIKITSANFNKEVLQSDKPVLLDFWAEWCGPCKELAPVLEEFAKKHPEIKVGKINIDEEPALASQHGITAIPTLILYKDGKIVKTQVGCGGMTALENMIKVLSAANNGPEVTITAANFNKEVLQSDKPVLLDFWAEWCGPCQSLAPVLEEFAKKHPEIKVGKINIDEEPTLANMHNITGIPTLILYKNGKIVKTKLGCSGMWDLEDMIK